MDFVPEAFAQRIQTMLGDQGREWVRALPRTLATLAERWQLRLEPPFPLTYNYVAPATGADGLPVVLKAVAPYGIFTTERTALDHYQGKGAVRLLRVDEAYEVLLLERVVPGTTLAATHWPDRDDEATRQAAEVMTRLFRPLADDAIAGRFKRVHDWAKGLERYRLAFNGGAGPLPPLLFAEAERLWAERLASSDTPAVLHGDLHHENILQAGVNAFVAIDPQGVLGEPAFEVGAFLRNPQPHFATHPEARKMTARRLDILSERLGFDRERLRNWGIANAVLSACWDLEDGGDAADARHAILCAEHLRAV